MGWFAKRRTPRTLSPVSGGAMIERYDGRTFAANDVLCIPAGWEALWVSGGAFSRVLREGDDRLPIEGRREVEGDLYFIRLAPEETFAWGCGGVRIGERTCGLHGSMRLEVASSRKLLSAFIGEHMPFTAERAFDRLLAQVLDAVACAARRVAQDAGTLEGVQTQIADVAREALEEPFEREGLAVAALTLEGIYISPGEQEV